MHVCICMYGCSGVDVFSPWNSLVGAHMFCQNIIWFVQYDNAIYNLCYASTFRVVCACMSAYAMAPLSDLNEWMLFFFHIRPDGSCNCTIFWCDRHFTVLKWSKNFIWVFTKWIDFFWGGKKSKYAKNMYFSRFSFSLDTNVIPNIW